MNKFLSDYDTFVEDVWCGPKTVEETELKDLYIMTSGLGGEAGEVLEKLKKFIRDDTAVDQKDLTKELGDVVYYVTKIAHKFDVSLEDVIQGNIDKLTARQAAGTSRGSGDNR